MKHHKFTLAILLGMFLAFPVLATDTVNLPPGYRLTVTADSVSIGSFWRLKDTDNTTTGSPTAVSASSSDTAGPFQVSSNWAINSTGGALTTSQAPVHFTDAETIDGINGAELLQRDGSIPLTSNWDAGAFTFTGTRFISDIATGTAPFGASSTTVVSNLNADTVDGVEAAAINQLAVAQQYTKQHSFDATTLTSMGADFVVNGEFTDGSDLVTNGSFTGDTDWPVKGDGWTLPGTVADSDASQSADSDLTQTIAELIDTEVFSIVFTGANRTAGNVTVVCGDTEGTDRATNAEFTELVTCGAGGDLDIRADVTYDGDVDDVSVVQVGDAGWTQGDGWLISTGSASSDATQSGDSDLERSEALVAGATYEVIFTHSNFNAGTVTAVVGNQEGTDRGSDATFTELIVATNTDPLKFRASATWDGTIDDITIRLATVSWALEDNQVTTITLDQNVAFEDPTNMVDGGIYTIHFIQDSTGTRIPTWDSAYLFEGGTAPTLTTTADTGHDIFRFISDGSSMFLISDTLDLQ